MDVDYETIIGKVRQHNEDAVQVVTNQGGVGAAIVADGLGGHQGGEIASKMAVSSLGFQFQQTTLTTPNAIEPWLQQVIPQENSAIIERSREYPDLAGMGTTLVCAFIFPREFVVAHVGDSRAYVFREGRLQQLTTDHSLVNELLAAGELKPEDVPAFPHKNVITRTLGISEQVKADVATFPFLPDDQLLLCTDGLYKLVDRPAMEQLLTTAPTVTAAVHRLVEAANAACGTDNITALVVKNEGGE